jgi:hypothetical protein
MVAWTAAFSEQEYQFTGSLKKIEENFYVYSPQQLAEHH